MHKRVLYKKSEEMLSAFEAAAVPHMGALFRVAMCLERDRGRAEGLVQETFLEALQSFHHFEPGTNCCAWLVAILYRIRRGQQPRFGLLH
jgi:DNA-directed RNA polymerase specialized sigma24 family protein